MITYSTTQNLQNILLTIGNEYMNINIIINFSNNCFKLEQSRPIISQIQDLFSSVDPVFYNIFIKNLNKNSDFTVNDYIEAQKVVKDIPVRIQIIFYQIIN